MDLTKYRNKLIGSEDERAVSPVIGVILMVAITVILAAVIAAFVLDIGDLDDSAPNAQFDWESDDGDVLSVTHTSGDDIDLSEIEVEDEDGAIDDENIDSDSDISHSDLDSETWTAGETIEFDDDGGSGDYPEEITIIWEGDGSSTVITEHEA